MKISSHSTRCSLFDTITHWTPRWLLSRMRHDITENDQGNQRTGRRFFLCWRRDRTHKPTYVYSALTTDVTRDLGTSSVHCLRPSRDYVDVHVGNHQRSLKGLLSKGSSTQKDTAWYRIRSSEGNGGTCDEKRRHMEWYEMIRVQNG